MNISASCIVIAITGSILGFVDCASRGSDDGTAATTHVAMPTAAQTSSGAYEYHGCKVYGSNDWFTTNLLTGGGADISDTVDAHSSQMLSYFDAAYGGVHFNINGSDASVHLQYGPANMATATTPLVPVHGLTSGFSDTPYRDDPGKLIPWQSSFHSQGSCPVIGQDCHSVVVTAPSGGPPGTNACVDYETYSSNGLSFDGARFTAGSLTVHNLNHPYNEQSMERPGSMVSGLPILGTVDLGEDASLPSINHSTILVLPGTDRSMPSGNCDTESCAAGGYVAPANAGATCAQQCQWAIPFGARLRLSRAKYSCPPVGVYPQANKICRQLQTYGAIVADHGSPHGTFGIPLGPSSDGTNPWKARDVEALNGIPLTDFDVMTLGPVHGASSS